MPPRPIRAASGTLSWPRKSDMASPIPVVRTFSAQNIAVISGTFAATGSVRQPRELVLVVRMKGRKLGRRDESFLNGPAGPGRRLEGDGRGPRSSGYWTIDAGGLITGLIGSASFLLA